jgi:hypothetical protein
MEQELENQTTMTPDEFNLWLKTANPYGQAITLIQASTMLGKSSKQLSKYKNGHIEIPLEVKWACYGLKCWMLLKKNADDKEAIAELERRQKAKTPEVKVEADTYITPTLENDQTDINLSPESTESIESDPGNAEVEEQEESTNKSESALSLLDWAFNA